MPLNKITNRLANDRCGIEALLYIMENEEGVFKELCKVARALKSGVYDRTRGIDVQINIPPVGGKVVRKTTHTVRGTVAA